jgi:hypothetical protein
MSAYDDAVATLFQASLGDFVAERKRLAAALKAGGDVAASTRLAKLARPSVSAWAVNQLWWQEREAFDALLAAAARVKIGDREAGKEHREALARLREHATRILQEAGNAATETTLRRLLTTLSSVAAIGGFQPDPPGALVADRDPPGFETLGFGASTATPAAPSPPQPSADSSDRRAEEAERRRAEEAERQRRAAERERLSTELRSAEQRREAQQRDVSRLRSELEAAEQGLKQSQALLRELEAELANL